MWRIRLLSTQYWMSRALVFLFVWTLLYGDSWCLLSPVSDTPRLNVPIFSAFCQDAALVVKGEVCLIPEDFH